MATGTTEVEFKFRVAALEDFERLATHVGEVRLGTPSQQVNRFFDTEDMALRRAKYSLRWRTESWPDERPDEDVIALKGPNTAASGSYLTSRAEEEKVLSEIQVEMLSRMPLKIGPKVGLGKSFPILDVVLDDSALVQQAKAVVGTKRLLGRGVFTNFRWRLPVPLPLVGGGTPLVTLELDETTFPGREPGDEVTHYEIEVEIPPGWDDKAPQIEQALRALFVAAGVDLLDVPPSGKAKRLFDSLEPA